MSRNLALEEVWLLRDIQRGFGGLILKDGDVVLKQLIRHGLVTSNVVDGLDEVGYRAWRVTPLGEDALKEHSDTMPQERPHVLGVPGTFVSTYTDDTPPAKTLQQIISDLKVRAYDHAHSAYHYEEYADSDIAEILEGIIADLERLEDAK